VNPIFQRFCRSELRVKKAIFWYLLVIIVCAFTVAVIYIPQVTRGQDTITAARAALLPMLIIQGLILLFMGTGSVASGIAREKVDQVLDYQRLTPLQVREKIIGYLFGLPVREYVLFLLTLPFMGFVLVVGRIPVGNIIPYYLVFLSSTLLYHITGFVAGMISRKWRWSARISQGLIVLLYFVLPQLSHVGLVFLEFLTVRPVFAEKILPLVSENPQLEMEGIGLAAGKQVPLFSLLISGTVFSFFIQMGLILLFAMIVARKWKADTVPAISKPMALVTFTTVSVISLGNIWPNLTRSDGALEIFQSSGDLNQALAIIALPLMLALVTTLLGFVLMISALPDPVHFRQGRIRAQRQVKTSLSPWDDEASGALLCALLILIQAGLQATSFLTLHKAGYFDGIDSTPLAGAALILVGALSLWYFRTLKESFGSGQLGLIALVHWLVPILAAILLFAIPNDALRQPAFMIAATSPLALIPFSTTLLPPPEAGTQEILQMVQRALGFGILFLTATTVWLQVRLRKKRSLAD